MPQRVAASWPIRPTVRYARHLAEALRAETLGGLVMLAAAVAALVWANTRWSGSYEKLQGYEFGPPWFHLDVTHFASGGLLAVFFFIAGVELRHEITEGELQDLKAAALPIFAAVAGVAAPALIFLAVSAGTAGASEGWAVPTATDIAFALAVLAITYTACPAPLRAFLLTLAVVDDLIAITIIAVFYTDHLSLTPLVAGIALIVLYAMLQRRNNAALLVLIAVAAWAFVYKSGVHATVAGVALGLLTDGRARGADASRAEAAEHYLRPVSAGLCVPLFAFVSAGVPLSAGTLHDVLDDRVALGVVAGLVIGKFVGVFGGAWLAVRLGLARLADDLRWREIAAVAMLAGVGFTVSLLIGDLAYAGTARNDRVTTAVLIASVLASAIAAVAFRIRVRQRALRT
jgi:NhaA family Na+:H+ antiporter